MRDQYLPVVNVLRLADLNDLGQDLGVGQFAVPKHGTPRLDGLYDLLTAVASQGKPEHTKSG